MFYVCHFTNTLIIVHLVVTVIFGGSPLRGAACCNHQKNVVTADLRDLELRGFLVHLSMFMSISLHVRGCCACSGISSHIWYILPQV